ncbi:site-2 protease family protein [Aestuariicoccus sp. MJ-SS9]|uniref:site-2 protease family protein n=1 Tax=Aestuariicoccus sp. MJ-SS9 TaxID=3079855 RepID=UPI00290B92E8|nr:site-2 protease family protein [Aestuariicoccus sp. MJ-SS9]MDU8912450.1 site-2 protease family protein [Aestuariicoccus sp. MJ-SS9]
MFSNAVKLFTINGFDIKIDPSWLLIAALITWSLSQHYFPESFPDQTMQTYVVMSVVAMLAFFGSLLLHELAHSVVARGYGVPIKGITLFLFGGVAELEAEPKTARVEFLVALAGPAMSLALALGFWVLAQLTPLLALPTAVPEVLGYLAMINLVLGLFNLVPAFPLDGGRVLRAYVWQRTGDILHATEVAARSGTLFAYLLMWLGMIGLFQGALVAGLWQILIGGFVLMAARGSYQAQLARSVFHGKTVRSLMSDHPITVGPDVTLTALADEVMLAHRISFVPVVLDNVLLGHIDSAILARIDRENWPDTRVGDVFVGLDPAFTVSGDLPAQDLMERISRTGQRKFMVTEDHNLRGVISLSDLVGFLHLTETLLHSHRKAS